MNTGSPSHVRFRGSGSTLDWKERAIKLRCTKAWKAWREYCVVLSSSQTGASCIVQTSLEVAFIAQAGLNLTTLQPWPLECWDYEHTPLRLALSIHSSAFQHKFVSEPVLLWKNSLKAKMLESFVYWKTLSFLVWGFFVHPLFLLLLLCLYNKVNIVLHLLSLTVVGKMLGL